MKKLLSFILAVSMITVAYPSLAVATDNGRPPEPPEGLEQPIDPPPEKPDIEHTEGTPPGGSGNGQPGEPPEGSGNGQPGEPPEGSGNGQPGEPPEGSGNGQPGEPPEGSGNGQPGEPPEGFGNGQPGEPPGGMMGGPDSNRPESYNAIRYFTEDTELNNESLMSAGKDENAVLTSAGSTVITSGSISRKSAESTGGDSASFYGVGAAALVTGGSLTISGTEITTDSAGGAGVFAYGDGVANVNDCTVTTMKNTSGGIHAAGGGTLNATNLTVVTNGESSAAIRSDRGGGVINVDGGSYTANGNGSPAVYVTADITVNNALLNATGSEALCLEGRNHVTLNSCELKGNMRDLAQNDNTWTVILYQSMSGDSEIGKGTFAMNGGRLISQNGGLFYTTNTTSEFTLNHVELIPCEDFEYLLRCTGNANQRGWGKSGANGADCTFTAIDQQMEGTVLWDSISDLRLNLTGGTVYTGAILDDESCAGEGGNGGCTVSIDADSKWIVTGDSTVTALWNDGVICDENGDTVTVLNADGSICSAGTGCFVITIAGHE